MRLLKDRHGEGQGFDLLKAAATGTNNDTMGNKPSLEVDKHTSNITGMVINSDNSSQEGAKTGHLGVVEIHMQAEAHSTNKATRGQDIREQETTNMFYMWDVGHISALCNEPPLMLHLLSYNSFEK